jgi:hypothetical protein
MSEVRSIPALGEKHLLHSTRSTRRFRLRCFDEVRKLEYRIIKRRRAKLRGAQAAPVQFPLHQPEAKCPANKESASTSLQRDYKTRPLPKPCDANGLALSGGGIRSAAVCLGALQALQVHHRLDWIDYLSTVSGGGYVGACLSASMTKGKHSFPFGEDVCDSPMVAHLRNYSNYIMPRGYRWINNASDAAVVILRGLVANATLVLGALLLFALATQLFEKYSPRPFTMTYYSLAGLVCVLLIWAVGRSKKWSSNWAGDAHGK